MSYNPFDDLPEAVKEEEKEDMEREQAPKRRKIDPDTNADTSIAECKEDDTCGASIKNEEDHPRKKVDVISTLQTLRKHIFNPKYAYEIDGSILFSTVFVLCTYI